MIDKKSKRKKRPPTPIVSIFRQGFQREVFRDLQDFLFEKFGRPSLVIIPLENGSLYSCFPRPRQPVPQEFFHQVMSLTHKRSSLEEYERHYASLLLSKESCKERVRWGWHESPMGLTDLYLPVRLKGIIVAVLVFGKFLPAVGRDMRHLQAWVKDIRCRMPTHRGLPDLEKLLGDIPSLSAKTKTAIEFEVGSLVSLTERFLDRTINTGLLFRDEELVDQLGLERPELNISADELWNSVQGALEKINQTLPVKSAAAFAAKYRKIDMLERKASVPPDSVPETLTFSSLEELEWLQGESWVNLPCEEGDYFRWLDTKHFLGAEHGVLFGKEMIGGHVVVLAFGLGKERLTPWQRAALYDAVTSRVFGFIDKALFGIELDHLMAETGHLMGRAVAKVALGVRTLQEFASTEPHDRDEEIYKTALWAIEDGKTRLELIKQNFYAFQTRRQQGAAEEALEEIDAIEMLNSMRSYFDRYVAESERKSIVYNIQEAPAMVLGDRNALRLTFLNLFDNAIKFSYTNTFFTIEASAESGQCNIVIRSLGVGVAKAEVKSVFQPFAKSRYRDPQRRIEGLGLGLSYCRWVIEDIFSGKIRLASSEVNAPSRKFPGDNWLTSVTIELPLCPQKPED